MLRTRRLFQQCEAGMWSLLDGSSFRTVQRFSSVSVTALETQHITVPIAPGKRLAIHASSPSHIHIKVGELESISVEIQARHQGFHTKETDEGLGERRPHIPAVWLQLVSPLETQRQGNQSATAGSAAAYSRGASQLCAIWMLFLHPT